MQHDLVEQFRAENERLKERIAELEALLVPEIAIPVEFNLTATESRLFAHLATRPLCSKRGLYGAAYDAWVDEPPHEQGIESHLSKMRRKLRPFGFQILSERFRGYWMVSPAGFEVRYG